MLKGQCEGKMFEGQGWEKCSKVRSGGNVERLIWVNVGRLGVGECLKVCEGMLKSQVWRQGLKVNVGRNVGRSVVRRMLEGQMWWNV